eukprot:4941449-Pyramimonas_sp.AAC.1
MVEAVLSHLAVSLMPRGHLGVILSQKTPKDAPDTAASLLKDSFLINTVLVGLTFHQWWGRWWWGQW